MTSGSSTTGELVERLEGALDSIDRLERYEGHLLNWYETHTLAAHVAAICLDGR